MFQNEWMFGYGRRMVSFIWGREEHCFAVRKWYESKFQSGCVVKYLNTFKGIVRINVLSKEGDFAMLN